MLNIVWSSRESAIIYQKKKKSGRNRVKSFMKAYFSS